MKRTVAIAAITLAAGCGVGPEAEEIESTEQALTGFTFDTTAIAARPTIAIPAARLTLAAFDENVIARSLLKIADTPKRITLIQSRLILESADFNLETDYARGQVLAVTKLLPGPAVPQDPQALDKAARAQLGAWGVSSAEMGASSRRKSMMQHLDGTVASPPELHRYKTFVQRALGGVPVVGHRAVISHNPDGRFARAFIKWPALAASGHRLRTALELPAIQKNALVRAGETGGRVVLRWRLVPVPQPNGEVQLVLKVGALIKAAVGDPKLGGDGPEPREIQVDVAAL